MSARASLEVRALDLVFQNPIVLAAGTAGYGRELAEVTDLERLGGLVTKSVSVEPQVQMAVPSIYNYSPAS